MDKKDEIITDYYARLAEAMRPIPPIDGYSAELEVGTERLCVSGCNTSKAAEKLVIQLAIKSGLQPPKWWQFWLDKWPAWAVSEHEKQLDGGLSDGKER